MENTHSHIEQSHHSQACTSSLHTTRTHSMHNEDELVPREGGGEGGGEGDEEEGEESVALHNRDRGRECDSASTWIM